MHIALVHMRHASIGGTELILERLSRRLGERGHQVTIVCRSHVAASHPAVRFEVLRSPVIGSAWRMWAFAQAAERHVQANSYDVVLGLGKTWSQDVLRTGGGSHATFMERMRDVHAASWREAPWLRTAKDRLALRIERRAFAPGAYRRIIANSNLVRDDVCSRYQVPLEHVEVIYNGVDLEKFHPRLRSDAAALRTQLGASEDDVVYLFLGKGFARKGLDRLLRAFVQVAAEHPRARLWVAGRDSSQAQYEELARTLGLEARVRFLGERKDPQVCLAACDVHVLPTHYDSFAFTVLEALAVGTPVITTDAAGAAELLSPGIDGEVLGGDCDSEELAQAMSRWCERERTRSAAVFARTCAERYGFDDSMDRMAQLLERTALEVRAAKA
jgi:UDP-glucose:(heptosyl)LPS alpha-1,3-glucosyltransferase